jgi:hypothetical protein
LLVFYQSRQRLRRSLVRKVRRTFDAGRGRDERVLTYAIGDIHGQFDKLEVLLDRCERHCDGVSSAWCSSAITSIVGLTVEP